MFHGSRGESRQQVRVKGEALEKLGEGFIADIQQLGFASYGLSGWVMKQIHFLAG